MSDKIYIVTETGFEYNDEVHRVTEGGGGDPVAAFTTREDAIADITSRSIVFLLGWGGDNLGCFGYETCEIFSKKPSFLEMDEEAFFELESYSIGDVLKLKERSRQELADLVGTLEFAPFDITAVTLG